MTTDAAKLMRLQSWLSPAFPIGAYSYSHGLERAVETGAVRDRATLVDWLEADIRHGAGRTDGIFFAEIWRAARCADLPSLEGKTRTSPAAQAPPLPWGEGGGEGHRIIDRARSPHPVPLTTGEGTGGDLPSEAQNSARGEKSATSRRSTSDLAGAGGASATFLQIAELAAAMRATSELALEASQQGIAFLSAVRKAWPHLELDRHAASLQQAGITPMLPIAAGLVCGVHDIALDVALPLYLHAGAANLINAAVRLVPLGQTDGQLALAALEAAVAETAAEALSSGIADIGSAAFMIDIASMQHETQYTRLFRS